MSLIVLGRTTPIIFRVFFVGKDLNFILEMYIIFLNDIMTSPTLIYLIYDIMHKVLLCNYLK